MAGSPNKDSQWYSADHRSSGPQGSFNRNRGHKPLVGHMIGGSRTLGQSTEKTATKRKTSDNAHPSTSKHRKLEHTDAPGKRSQSTRPAKTAESTKAPGRGSKENPIQIDLDEPDARPNPSTPRVSQNNLRTPQVTTPMTKSLPQGHSSGGVISPAVEHVQNTLPRPSELSVDGFRRPTIAAVPKRFQQSTQNVSTGSNAAGSQSSGGSENIPSQSGQSPAVLGTHENQLGHGGPCNQRAQNTTGGGGTAQNQPRPNGNLPVGNAPNRTLNSFANQFPANPGSHSSNNQGSSYSSISTNPRPVSSGTWSFRDIPNQNTLSQGRTSNVSSAEKRSSNNHLAPSTAASVPRPVTNPASNSGQRQPPIVLRPSIRPDGPQHGGQTSAVSQRDVPAEIPTVSQQQTGSRHARPLGVFNNEVPLDYGTERVQPMLQTRSESQNQTTPLFNIQRGGVVPTSSISTGVLGTPARPDNMGHISSDEANSLMYRSRSLAGLRSAQGNQQNQAYRKTLSSHRDDTPSERKRFRDTGAFRYRQLEPQEVTEQHWMILDLRNRGLDWKEIQAQWPALTGEERSPNFFYTRFHRMRNTYPHLVTHPRDRKALLSGTVARDEAIARNMQEHGEMYLAQNTSTEDGNDVTQPSLNRERPFPTRTGLLRHIQNSQEGLASAPEASDSARPTTGGKYISEDLKNHILATLDDNDAESELASESEDDFDDFWRANSPVEDEDFIHYVYHVKWRVIGNHEDQEDVDWHVSEDGFTLVSEANEAAFEVVKVKASEAAIGTFTGNMTQRCEKTGLVYLRWSGKKAVLEVAIHRSLRTYHDQIKPPNKFGWQSKEIFEATAKQTVFDETVEYEESSEWGEDQVMEDEVEIDDEGYVYELDQATLEETLQEETLHTETSKDEPSQERPQEEQEVPEKAQEETFHDSAYSSQSGGDDCDEDEDTAEVPLVVDEDSAIDNDSLFGEEIASSKQPSVERSSPTEEPKPENLTRSANNGRQRIPRVTVIKTRILKQKKTITKNYKEVEESIEGLSADQNRANKIAADEFLRLRKEQNPDPEAARPSVRNWELGERQKREMDKKLKNLEQTDECFKDKFEFSRGNEDTDDDRPPYRGSLTTEVQVRKRALLNPRNF